MQGSPVSTRIAAIAALVLATGLVTACGSDETPEQTGEPADPAPAASAFPDAPATLDELTAEVPATQDLVALPAGAVFMPEPKPQRFGFGMFEVDQTQILDAEVALYAAHGPDGKALGPFPARVEDLTTEPEFVAQTTAEDDAKVVYVADLPLDEPGEWRLVAVVRTPDGLESSRLPSIDVQPFPEIPAPGEPAREVHTPTLDDVGSDVESIDTRVPPSTMHGEDLADVLGEKPVVLLFATPALCVSRVCGPVVDVAEQVKAEYGDDVAFIHMEIYEGNVAGPKNLRPQVEAYGLPTEPWLFVIDADGRVSTRIEGAFSAAELEDAIDRVLE